MHKKKVMTVTGIRPDFIRMSKVFERFDNSHVFDHILVHSGQHYDDLLSGVFFKDLKIRTPDYNLKIGADGKQHYDQVSDLSSKLIKLCHEIKPDLIMFLGDSNSVLSAIPLKKEGFNIARVEVGMRSGNLALPEEINRQCAEIVTDLFFAYTELNRQNLINEGKDRRKIYVVGNTIYEPLMKIIKDKDLFSKEKTKDYILMDIHRHSNVTSAARMQRILDYANALSEIYHVPVKMLSFGRAVKLINENNLNKYSIEFIDLMSFSDFISFQYNALFSISDSGTSVEECPILKTPVIVPRDETERPQAVTNKCCLMLNLSEDTNEIVFNLNYNKILAYIHRYESGDFFTQDFTNWVNGINTSAQILNATEYFFNK